ncbi:MAG TPA: hypothetical protein VGM92_09805 [Candidatus Kapabacteria bacterium]
MGKTASRTAHKINILNQRLRNDAERKRYPQMWYAILWIVYLVYCYAAFVPTGPVWGIHFTAYVPPGLKVGVLILGALLLIPRNQEHLFNKVLGLFHKTESANKVRIIPTVALAIAAFFLFHSFEIKTDIYGDDIHMLKEYGENTEFNGKWIMDIISPHWVDNKEALTVAVHRIVAHTFSISIEQSYTSLSEICGAIFVFLWIWFIQKITIADNDDPRRIRVLQLILSLLGVCSGATLVFYGHVENYAFGILAFTTFLLALYFYVEEKIGTVPFILLFLFAVKAHIVGILFLPAFLVALAYRYRSNISFVQELFSWRQIRNVVIAPAFVIGVILYIFLFHSWNEPYALTEGRQFERSFLPVLLQPAPLNHYSLWSPYHLADLVNLFLLIAAPVLITVSGILFFTRRAIEWNRPNVIVFGLAALFPFLFFLAMNPMLSPMRDWDVFSLFLPSILFFAAMVLVQKGVRGYESAWLAQTVVFGTIFTLVLVAVNFSPDELQVRLQDAGAHTYRSYYAGSDYIEARSFALNDSATEHPHFAHLVATMAMDSKGNDEELASMESRLASFYAFIQKDDSAIMWAQAACRTDGKVHRYVADLAGYLVQADHLEDGSQAVESYLISKRERNDSSHADDEELAAVMSQLGARYSRQGSDSLTVYWAAMARRTAPHILTYTYDLANYYMQSNRPQQALELFHTIPADSLNVTALTGMAMAAAYAYGPDSGMNYLLKAKTLAPNDRSIDSLITEMRAP